MLKVRCNARGTVDEKGRLSLPAPIRAALEKAELTDLVMSCYGGAVWVWTPVDYEEHVESRVGHGNEFDVQTMDFVHTVCAFASDTEVDKAGRIRIPPELREVANIGREVQVFATPNHLEIWDVDAWQKRSVAARESLASRNGGIA